MCAEKILQTTLYDLNFCKILNILKDVNFWQVTLCGLTCVAGVKLASMMGIEPSPWRQLLHTQGPRFKTRRKKAGKTNQKCARQWQQQKLNYSSGKVPIQLVFTCFAAERVDYVLSRPL